MMAAEKGFGLQQWSQHVVFGLESPFRVLCVELVLVY